MKYSKTRSRSDIFGGLTALLAGKSARMKVFFRLYLSWYYYAIFRDYNLFINQNAFKK
ncbi:MAG TPA: hypothetical protein VKN74_07600 [Candidatus Mcinerneyibacterium sp.]|nr:hypothetical protein [Candidatus Mcinerneyibacterium sp.]